MNETMEIQKSDGNVINLPLGKKTSKKSPSPTAKIDIPISPRHKVAEVKHLIKTYGAKGFQAKVLKGIDLTIYKHDFVAIMGPSGSGKTTLLNILSTIDKPTQGIVILDGQDITKASNKELSRLRRDKIGFIFQDYNLLDTMTLQDNIALPLSLNGTSGRVCIQKAQETAALFGLKDHLKKYPYQLSGGQKQRGACCRALITNPEIIFADEPTGALDSKAGRELLECLKMVNDSGQATILMVLMTLFAPLMPKTSIYSATALLHAKSAKEQNGKNFMTEL